MLKTITPIDNSVYVERPYANAIEIETALESSYQTKINWKNTSTTKIRCSIGIAGHRLVCTPAM